MVVLPSCPSLYVYMCVPVFAVGGERAVPKCGGQ